MQNEYLSRQVLYQIELYQESSATLVQITTLCKILTVYPFTQNSNWGNFNIQSMYDKSIVQVSAKNGRIEVLCVYNHNCSLSQLIVPIVYCMSHFFSNSVPKAMINALWDTNQLHNNLAHIYAHGMIKELRQLG